MDVEEKFHLEGKLVCPKCKGELSKRDVDYRKAGVWCTCRDCGKSFDMPFAGHFCRECRHVFLFEGAVFKEAYVYRLNEAVKNEFLVGAITAPFRRLLEEKGYKVEMPGSIKGKSSVIHLFDILAYREKLSPNIIAVNLVFSLNKEPVSNQHVIEMFAKKFDANVEVAFLIAIPGIVESGRKLADLYGIKVIEAEKLDEALKILEAFL
jgi:predicted RNA-binding Zn-ribbon protein involved in translation (DUF1610 family)